MEEGLAMARAQAIETDAMRALDDALEDAYIRATREREG